jgi:transcription termination factor Rho
MEVRNLPEFKSLVTIDPDFHYAVGDASGETAMRILDVICPVGRGQRGLRVAPPRGGKTTILRQFAKGIEKGYPDVKLMILLVDERPEEATEWRRSTNGHVFVSTADETAKTHVALAEAVWKRATRMVETGEEVVLLLDSITRLARAYNNLSGGSGRTMSGGLDSQAMQRPRQIFGRARNTEKAGSLTILGTTLVETGSKMDQLIFGSSKARGTWARALAGSPTARSSRSTSRSPAYRRRLLSAPPEVRAGAAARAPADELHRAMDLSSRSSTRWATDIPEAVRSRPDA